MNQCNISWHSFKKDICDGLTHLQQEQEFVDMTLAAEGHMVKVHKNLIALSSPYLRQMLHSIPCQHPVIFLNNIRHDILSLLLEYIYTGEVNVPVEKVNLLLDAAKALHIKGLQGELASTLPELSLCQDQVRDNENLITKNTISNRVTLSNKRKHSNNDTGKCKNEYKKSRKTNFEMKNIHDKQTNTNTITGNADFSDLIQYHKTASASDHINISNENDKISQNTGTSLVQLDENTHFVPNTVSNKNKDPNLDSHNVRNESEKNMWYNNLPVVTSLQNNSNEEDNSNAHTGKNLNIVTEQSNTVISCVLTDLPNNVVIHKTNADNNSTSEKSFLIMPQSNEMANKDTNPDVSTPAINIQVDLNKISHSNENLTSNSINGNADVEYINMNCEYTDNFMIDVASATYQNTETVTQPIIISQMKDSITLHEQEESTKAISVKVQRQEGDPKSFQIDLQANTTSQGEICDADNLLKDNSPLFVITSRGCLQLILNRYMYYCHYGAFSGHKRRWRCIDYRRQKCKAFIDTEGGIVTCRKNVHTHPFHDKKILKKGQSSIVHTSLAQVLEEAAKKNGLAFESETVDLGSDND